MPLRVIGSVSMQPASATCEMPLVAVDLDQRAPLRQGHAVDARLVLEAAAIQPRHVMDEEADRPVFECV